MLLCNSKVGFPVFDAVESAFDSGEFVLCGGGGSARSGVFNRVVTCTLGPRPDGHAGTSLVELAAIDTGKEIATSCCFLSGQLVCYALGSELVVSERNSAESTSPTTRINVGEPIEVVRSFNQLVFVGTELGSILVYSADLKHLVARTRLHLAAVVDFSFTPAYLSSCSADGTVRIWHLHGLLQQEDAAPTLAIAAILPAKQGMTFREARFLPGNRLVALQVPKSRKGACFASVFVKRTSPTGGEFVLQSMAQVASSLATGMAANQRYLAVGSADSTVLFSSDTLQPINTALKVHGLPVTGLFFRAGVLVSTSADATAAMINVDMFAAGGKHGGSGKSSCAARTMRLLAVLASLVFFLVACVLVFVAASGLDGTQPLTELASSASSPPKLDFARVTPHQLQLVLHNLVAGFSSSSK